MVIEELRGGQLHFLKKTQTWQIHQGSLEVLESIGMKSASHEILEVFSNIRAEVDPKTKHVKIPTCMRHPCHSQGEGEENLDRASASASTT